MSRRFANSSITLSASDRRVGDVVRVVIEITRRKVTDARWNAACGIALQASRKATDRAPHLSATDQHGTAVVALHETVAAGSAGLRLTFDLPVSARPVRAIFRWREFGVDNLPIKV